MKIYGYDEYKTIPIEPVYEYTIYKTENEMEQHECVYRKDNDLNEKEWTNMINKIWADNPEKTEKEIKKELLKKDDFYELFELIRLDISRYNMNRLIGGYKP